MVGCQFTGIHSVTTKGTPEMKVTKRSVYSGLAGAGILLGAAGISAAATGSDPAPDSTVVAQQDDSATPTENEADEADETNESGDEDHEGREHGQEGGAETPPDYTSSIQTSPEVELDDATETDATEAEQDASLAALATVTPAEAEAAASAAQPGTVKEAKLSNEAGNVVYEVEIVDDAGAEFDVIVDAGNGDVLASAVD